MEKHPHIPARYIIDRVVLGGSDGVIEAVATTSALNGARVGFSTILLAGLAFAVAGAISMFISSYLSRRSEIELLKTDVEREMMEIETEPEEERAELEGLLRKDGYSQAEVDVIMGRLTRNKELWLREQLSRELKLHLEDLATDPFTRPVAAGAAFFSLAILVLVPYAFPVGYAGALGASLLLSLAALFTLGSRIIFRGHFNALAGVESALVGAVAAAIMYAVGILISGA